MSAWVCVYVSTTSDGAVRLMGHFFLAPFASVESLQMRHNVHAAHVRTWCRNWEMFCNICVSPRNRTLYATTPEAIGSGNSFWGRILLLLSLHLLSCGKSHLTASRVVCCPVVGHRVWRVCCASTFADAVWGCTRSIVEQRPGNQSIIVSIIGPIRIRSNWTEWPPGALCPDCVR